MLSCVVSDHSPSTPDLKVPDFAAAWGGISSLQLGLTAVWTEAVAARARPGGRRPLDVRSPAALAGLRGKGAIAVGADADLVAFDADAVHTVDVASLHHKNPVTPYHGRTLTGVVRTTWLRGRTVGRSRGPSSPGRPTRVQATRLDFGHESDHESRPGGLGHESAVEGPDGKPPSDRLRQRSPFHVRKAFDD